MKELKNYQEDAVSELREKSQRILDSTPGTCVFKSPTGSGKTLMTAECIKRLSCDFEKKNKLSYIWISVHNLHLQSKEKLENYYQNSNILTCSEFDNLEDDMIQEDEILFFNWESITRDVNIFIRKHEQRANLSEVIENTRNEGRKIILIIDESHHTAKGEKSQELINKINPDLSIEVSATPSLTELDQLTTVDYQDVINEEMIKKQIIINSQIDKIQINSESMDEFTINAALQKREHLLECYKKYNINVNPLILIQLPDKMQGVSDKKDKIIEILQKFNVTIDNEKLAIHLSNKEDKINLENIEDNDNKVEVLIFKQALALGWDCPRASILVLLREWRSIEFSIQTIGRIMRTPEHRFYNDESLNYSYVYSNITELTIVKDIAKDYLVKYESVRRNDLYDGISLPSIYIKRSHEKTRISGKITPIMQEHSHNISLLSKINTTPSKIIDKIMVDGKILKLDKVQTIFSENNLRRPMFAKDLDGIFEIYSKNNVGKFAPKHSSGMIRTALYKFCEHKLDITDYTEVQKLVLSVENNQLFDQIISNSREEYERQVVARIIKDEIEYVDWQVPFYTAYGSIHVKKNYKKAIMKPQYIKEYQNEINFMDFIDNPANNVKWWFKNGERDKKYFAISWYLEGTVKPFYVDFVLKMKDGTVGLFDTKKGATAESPETKYKAEALSKYLLENNTKSRSLVGGIVIPTEYGWKYNDNKVYEYDPNNLSDWKIFNF